MGPSFGIGNEFQFGKSKRIGFNFDINFLIRSQKVFDDFDEINNIHTMSTELKDPMPVQISIGYHIEF
jgi:hypothetical protein